MKILYHLCTAVLFSAITAMADEPKLPGVGAAMERLIARNEMAGAVTLVVTKNNVI